MKWITKKTISLPTRKKNARKGDAGRVLAIGGSKDYVGALALAGLAALRSGTDWVTIAAPEKVAWSINKLSMDLVTVKLPGSYLAEKHFAALKKAAAKHTVLLVGNGAGLHANTKKLLRKVCMLPHLKVIDADGIKVVAAKDLENSILTPHLKELESFLLNSKVNKAIVNQITAEKDVERRALLARKALTFLGEKGKDGKNFFQKNNVLILKGAVDAIIAEKEIYYNKTGNPGMAKAGTGDVLAGLAAGFLTQSENPVQSAINATYFNGLIGDILKKKKQGFTYLASDMVAEIQRLVR